MQLERGESLLRLDTEGTLPRAKCLRLTGLTKVSGEFMKKPKKGLYYNIMKKRERIAKGSGERMRKPGTKGAPTAQNFKDAAKTARS